MRLQPYLTFNGNCEAAFRFYEGCLGGKIAFMLTYGESPMAAQTPPELHHKILHATFALGDQQFGGADVPPDRYQEPQGITLNLNLKSAEEAERIYKALSENGVGQLPLQETFWAVRFGEVIDQFGIPWVINCEAG